MALNFSKYSAKKIGSLRWPELKLPTVFITFFTFAVFPAKQEPACSSVFKSFSL